MEDVRIFRSDDIQSINYMISVDGTIEQRAFSRTNYIPGFEMCSGNLPEVFNFYVNHQFGKRGIARIWMDVDEPNPFHHDIGSQLPFGSVLSASYETSSGAKQKQSGYEKKSGEDYEKRISDFHPVTSYRPVLGSLVAVLLCILASFFSVDFGFRLQGYGWRHGTSFGLALGIILGLWGIIGLLFSFDPWSLLRRL